MRAPGRVIGITLCLAAPALTRCAANRNEGRWLEDQSTGAIVITAEQIETSGARTAWEAIRQLAPAIQTAERRDGSPGRLQRRGRSSIYLSDAPLIFLDGVRVSDFRNLQLIPARDIASIRILTGIAGTTYFGTNAVNGVILVRTKSD
jgi:outer membrane cobalamin receptor